MPGYLSARETAEKWNISQRRVAILCAEKRVAGAMFVGNMWIIPDNAVKPQDKRVHGSLAKEIAPLKPFVKWAGGKSQLVNKLGELIAREDTRTLKKYAEPMVGGGALFFDVLFKHEFEEYYIGDNNTELINAYRAIKNNEEELIEKLKKMQQDYLPMNIDDRKRYYYSVREKFNDTPLSDGAATEKAALFIFLNKTCFNGLYRVNGKGQFNVPMGAYKCPKICDEDNLRNISAALKSVTIVHGDYSLCKNFADKNTFVYLDPPYRPISATSSFTSYNAEAFDDSEQFRLAKFADELNARGVKFALSNSDPKNTDDDDNFFDELYKDYTIERIGVSRMINSKAERRGKIKELIIYN